MDKKTFDTVKTILTTHRIYANSIYYSLSLNGGCYGDIEYYNIDVYSNSPRGSFHSGYATFFCQVAEVAGCHCYFKSVNGVCVCRFS